MNTKSIINKLPYAKPFLFVDELHEIDEQGVSGSYTFTPDHNFYQGHFKNNPVTPGVILTECMAQIGVVCLGIFLIDLNSETTGEPKIALTSTNIEYFKPVFPGEKVKVISKKIYFRFQKLKCEVQMLDSENEIVCKGEISGMLKKA